MNQIINLSLVLCVIGSAFAQIPSFGGCPTVKTQSSLDLQRYLGYWYEVQVFPTIFEKGKCTRARYTMKADGHIEVYNRGIEHGKVNDIVGEVYRPDDHEPAKLKVRFSSNQPWGDYWVIHTDYDHYTLIYSCGNIGGLVHTEMAWILSRNMTLDATTTGQLKQELASFGVDVGHFKAADQTDCPE